MHIVPLMSKQALYLSEIDMKLNFYDLCEMKISENIDLISALGNNKEVYSEKQLI